MNTQTQATQELSDAQLEAISGGCCKRYEDDDCYKKRHCDRDDYEEKSYCDDSYQSSGCDYDSSSCHERRHRHHGCR